MASKLFNLILDLSGQNLVPHIDIRRNDYDSNVFSVQVTQGGLPFDFTGMNPIFECLTPDGHYIRDDGSQYGTIHVVDATQGKLEYTLVNEVFAVLGQIDVAYFAFEQSNADLQNPTNRVSTGNFSMRIIADALTGTTAAQDYMSDVTTLIQQINQLKTDYQTLNPTNYVTQTQFGTQNDSVASQLAEMETQENHTADKNYLENMIQTAFSGMGEPYDTLANLQIAYPNGNQSPTGGYLKPHVVTADGNWYFYSTVASAWKSGGLYQAVQIAPKSIKHGQTNYYSIDPTGNLIDYESITQNTALSNTDGSLIADSGIDQTDYMPVSGITSLKVDFVGYMTWFDKNKTFISQSSNVTSGMTYSVPVNAAYARYGINKGSSGAAYTNKTGIIADVQYYANGLQTRFIDYSLSVPKFQTDTVSVKKLGKNLINKDAVNIGYFPSGTSGFYKNSANISYDSSDYIPVCELSYYSANIILSRVSFLNAQGLILSTIDNVQTFKTPTGCKFIVCSYPTGSQVILSNKNLPPINYEKYQEFNGNNLIASRNLVDENCIAIGQVTSDSQMYVENSGYNSTHLIKVTSGKTYTFFNFYGIINTAESVTSHFGKYLGFRNVTFWDKNLNHVTGTINDPTNSQTQITVPPGAIYMVISYKSGGKNIVVAEGAYNTYDLPYEPYGYYYKNDLYGKTLLCFGDSIMQGDNSLGISFPELIAMKNNMICIDESLGGATICSSTSNNILTQVNDAISKNLPADYILFDGLTNDIAPGSTVVQGSISNGYSATLDVNTFCGAFETICKTLINTWLGKKIIYVRVHNMGTRDETLQQQWGDLAVQICKKWSIPVVDLFNEGGLNTNIPAMTAYTDQGTHPTENGYNIYYVPKIASKMASI